MRVVDNAASQYENDYDCKVDDDGKKLFMAHKWNEKK